MGTRKKQLLDNYVDQLKKYFSLLFCYICELCTGKNSSIYLGLSVEKLLISKTKKTGLVNDNNKKNVGTSWKRNIQKKNHWTYDKLTEARKKKTIKTMPKQTMRGKGCKGKHSTFGLRLLNLDRSEKIIRESYKKICFCYDLYHMKEILKKIFKRKATSHRFMLRIAEKCL